LPIKRAAAAASAAHEVAFLKDQTAQRAGLLQSMRGGARITIIFGFSDQRLSVT
jgi:hypothetical protein